MRAKFFWHISIYQIIGFTALDYSMPLKDIIVDGRNWREFPAYFGPLRLLTGLVLIPICNRLEKPSHRAGTSVLLNVASSLFVILPGHNIGGVWIIWAIGLSATIAYILYLDDFSRIREELSHLPQRHRVDYLKLIREDLILFFTTSWKALITLLTLGVGTTATILWRSFGQHTEPGPREVVVAFMVLGLFLHVAFGFASWVFIPILKLLRAARNLIESPILIPPEEEIFARHRR